jgi:parallel beta-helix repeat protein
MKRLLSTFVLITALASGAVAAAVRHVDPAHSSAQDSGDGNAQRPYRTLGYAMKQLKPGDTLNIAPGVYREALIFPEIAWSGAPTMVQPAGNGEVLIKGSDVVTGWELVQGGMFVKRSWKTNSQQVFVDGVALQQVGGTILGGYPGKAGHPMAKLHATQGGIWPGRVAGGVEQMKDNSFHYDAAAQSLYIKVPHASLDGHTVEASVRPHLVFGKGVQNVTLKKLRFQHANTSAVNQTGAVHLWQSSRNVLEELDVSHVDGAGFDITGDENTIRRSKANHCGQLGMKVRGRANKLTGNETSFNNTRGFNKWWEAGGAKFVGEGGLRDSEVSGHRALGNRGDGIWFDWMNSNNRVHDNVSAYNAGFGIHYEASQKGYIYNNYVFGNRQRGIYLPHSSDSVVAYNLVVKNGYEGIAVIDEGRSKSKPELVPRANRVLGNIIAWNGRSSLVLPAGLHDNAADYNLYVSAKDLPGFSIGWGSRESPIRKGLDAWRTASGQDTHSWIESSEVPQPLLAALEAQQPNPDWTQVMALASRFTVPGKQALSGTPLATMADQSSPGPKKR